MYLYYRLYTGIIFLFLLSLSSARASSPDSSSAAPIQAAKPYPAWFIGAKFYGGYTYSAYERIRNLEAHTMGYELLISKATFGENAWQQIHSYPHIGIAINYINLGKPGITGDVLAVIPHMQWNFFGKQSSALGLRFGAGFGYFNTVFNPITDYRNKAISTHINAALQLNLIYTQRIFKYVEMNAGIGVTHFSNGSFQLPNSGINIPALYLGVNYILYRPETLIQRTSQELAVAKKMYFYAYSAISFETTGFNHENHYTVYSLSSCYGKRVSKRSKLGMGVDMFYNPTIITDYKGNVLPANHDIDKLQAGIKLEHELVIGNLGFVTNFGTYVYHRTTVNGPFYQIIGLKYNFHPNIFCGVFLKTHFADADFVQMSVGVSF